MTSGAWICCGGSKGVRGRRGVVEVSRGCRWRGRRGVVEVSRGCRCRGRRGVVEVS